MKKVLALILCLGLLAGGVIGCGGEVTEGPISGGETAEIADAGEQTAAPVKIVVGVTPKPHGEILEVVKPLLEEQNINLEIKPFTDYVLLNPALKDKQIDANFFQHIPYLDDYNSQNNADLVWTVKVHAEPMGVYSSKIDDLDDLAEGALVGTPNDATNAGRALAVLVNAGLIELREDAGITATDRDIIDNPKNLKIQMMDAPMLARALNDLDICVINSNYAIEANLNPIEDSIFMEAKDTPFANVLAVRPEDKDKEAIVKLGEALQSPEVKQFLEEKYQGSCVPAF
ncbi:MAG: MetQ/NlpA family ABC transporter substrate-binding protein [Firmicutes bacterium]|nr:MetQ/NlpA family ABC transporter substrate-binding protein [Bacillota bacterium]